MLQLTLKRETETKRASERENINNVNTIVCLKQLIVLYFCKKIMDKYTDIILKFVFEVNDKNGVTLMFCDFCAKLSSNHNRYRDLS